MKSLGIAGVRVGHWTHRRGKTGCTVLLCDRGAVGGVDVRGSAPGTRETDLLRGYNLVERVNAVLLTGGSAFGLDAAAGIMQYLEERGQGVDMGVTVVPIVPAAVIFDLAVGDWRARPNKRSGYLACAAAAEEFETGRVGAGTGATVGKFLGQEYAMPGGFGAAVAELPGGARIAAVAVVNALGNIVDPDTGRLVAGAKCPNGVVPFAQALANIPPGPGNTTIGAVVTDAALTREEANKLAAMAHDGLALAVRPAHTNYDGDTFFALSTCAAPPVPMVALCAACADVVSRAVLDAAGAFDKRA